MMSTRPVITWIASYPKSGNTWVRMFLANYFSGADAPVNINDSTGPSMAAARSHFDRFAAVGAAELTMDEIDLYRPAIHRALAATLTPPVVVKVHDLFRTNAAGEWLFPPDITSAAIYVVRDPRDVAISLSHHRSCSLDLAVAEVCRPNVVIAPAGGGRFAQVPQLIGSWSQHVLSWLDARQITVIPVRYEDLLARPLPTFAALVHAIGLQVDDDRLQRAVAFSQIDQLQAQEKAHGFRERVGASPFFRSGRSGSWRSELSSAHIADIERAHGEVMARFDYGAGEA